MDEESLRLNMGAGAYNKMMIRRNPGITGAKGYGKADGKGGEYELES